MQGVGEDAVPKMPGTGPAKGAEHLLLAAVFQGELLHLMLCTLVLGPLHEIAHTESVFPEQAKA